MYRVMLIDPLTLLGRETAAALEDVLSDREAIGALHTNPDEEHEIADVAGRATIIPALSSGDDLPEGSIVVLTGHRDSTRLDVLSELLGTRSDLLVVDASAHSRFTDRAEPVIDPRDVDTCRLVRPAHPGVVVSRRLLEAVQDLEPHSLSLFAVDPVSTSGTPAVEALAHQAAERLQGAPVETLVDDQLRAFNLLHRGAEQIAEDAARLLPGTQTTAARSRGGCFHGTVVHLAVTVTHPATVDDLTFRLESRPEFEVVHDELALDAVPDRDAILTSPPECSLDGRTFALVAMVDGLRIGGALTIAALITGLQNR